MARGWAMGRVFALADLHLSETGLKPMDRFGELWREHSRRMAEAWDRSVRPDDHVLLAGDISWARNPAEAVPDLAWIAARPGRKVLLRGNHDGWWTSLARVHRLLSPDCVALQHDSVEAGPWIVVGARGWTAPDDPMATAADGPIFRRELERLRLSVAHADATWGRERPRLAMLHFPPFLMGHPPSEVVGVLRDAGVRRCVYGHLHGDDHRLAPRGLHDGIHFHFVAADATGFTPVELPQPSDGAS